jgi:hypothetical protein
MANKTMNENPPAMAAGEAYCRFDAPSTTFLLLPDGGIGRMLVHGYAALRTKINGTGVASEY